MTDIYQTLEDKDNDEEIERHGPYFAVYMKLTAVPRKVQKSHGSVEGIIFGTLA